MRRILAGLALALLIASPVTAAKPYSINVVQSVVTVGSSVDIEWTAPGSVWAKMTCIGSVGVGLVGFEYLSDPEPDDIGTGPTPSWDGSTSLVCTVGLYPDAHFERHARATDTFDLVP